jgi:hypothetical protein
MRRPLLASGGPRRSKRLRYSTDMPKHRSGLQVTHPLTGNFAEEKRVSVGSDKREVGGKAGGAGS